MSLHEIYAILLQHCVPLEVIALAPQDAIGLVISEAVVSRESLPRFANSAMDGYAIRSDDSCADGVFLDVVGSTMAGQERAGAIGVNQAVRIMTGAPVP